MEFFCIYKDCNHSYLENDCYFRPFPSDDATFRVWKRYAGVSHKQVRPWMNPSLCSCHFQEASNYPMAVLRLGQRSKCDESLFKEEYLEDDLNSIDPNIFEDRSATGIECFENRFEETEMYVETLESPEESLNFSLPMTLAMTSPNELNSAVDVKKLHEENQEFKSKYEEFKSKYEEFKLKYEVLKSEHEDLQDRVSDRNKSFDIKDIEHSDSKIFAYTGLPSKAVFDIVFKTLSNLQFNYVMGWEVVRISKENQFLMTLMKLRMDLRHFDLAERFKCSEATVSNIVRTWVLAMHEIFFLQLMSVIPSRWKNRECLPSSFKNFSNCRIVIDGTEMFIDKPMKMNRQKATFSPYKHHVTVKNLLGIAPNGVATYSSEFYPGSTSDKKLVQHCEILQQMEPGDLMLADKGFLIRDILPMGVNLNIPPFLTTTQFTSEQVRRTEAIAKARVHVERTINRAKNFRINQYIPAEMFSIATEIFQLCVALTNFQYPIIREVAMFF